MIICISIYDFTVILQFHAWGLHIFLNLATFIILNKLWMKDLLQLKKNIRIDLNLTKKLKFYKLPQLFDISLFLNFLIIFSNSHLHFFWTQLTTGQFYWTNKSFPLAYWNIKLLEQHKNASVSFKIKILKFRNWNEMLIALQTIVVYIQVFHKSSWFLDGS